MLSIFYTISLSIGMSVCQLFKRANYLPVDFPHYRQIIISVHLSSTSPCLPVCPFNYRCLSMFMCIFTDLSGCPYLCFSLPIRLSIAVSPCLFTYQCINVTVGLSASLSLTICFLFVYQFHPSAECIYIFNHPVFNSSLIYFNSLHYLFTSITTIYIDSFS